MTACGIERISDDTYVDASVQHFPKVDGWKVIHNFLQKYFIYKKYGISLHPPTRWQRLKNENIS
jgi:hypothetical protein